MRSIIYRYFALKGVVLDTGASFVLAITSDVTCVDLQRVLPEVGCSTRKQKIHTRFVVRGQRLYLYLWEVVDHFLGFLAKVSNSTSLLFKYFILVKYLAGCLFLIFQPHCLADLFPVFWILQLLQAALELAVALQEMDQFFSS